MGLSYQQRKLLSIAAVVILIILVAKYGSQLLSGPKELVKNTVGKLVDIPANSLTLSKEDTDHKLCLQVSCLKLWNDHHLKPFKSRGATIFLDDKGDIRIPPDYILQRMELRDLEELYHLYLGTIQTLCKRKLHLGQIVDGGYDICQDESVAPSSPCLMYSFGVRDDFSFDEEVVAMYGCEVHSFDPANGMKDHKHSNNVYFHSMGLGGSDGVINDNWKMRTFSSIKKELGHNNRKIEIVKIDIEGGEWPAFASMAADGIFKDVKQLITELHTWVDLPPAWTVYHRNEADYRQHLSVLRAIYDEGFRIFFLRRFDAACCMFRDNFGIQRTGCNEVHFMKVV